MTEQNCEDRVTQLEMLFSEQEYTVETLNTIVTEQARTIELLSAQLQALKDQLQEIKHQVPGSSAGDEKPPHY